MKRLALITIILLLASAASVVASIHGGAPPVTIPNFPNGVTFQCLDGETVGSSWVAGAGANVVDPTSCTHNYYARNNFTYVTANPNPTFAAQANFKWDSKDLFLVPIFNVQPDPAISPFDNISSAAGACGSPGCTANEFQGVDALESDVLSTALPIPVIAGICGNGGPGGSTCGASLNGQVQGPKWTDVGNPTPQPLVVGINLGETQDPLAAFPAAAAGVLPNRIIDMTMQQSDVNGTQNRITAIFTATIDNGSGAAGKIMHVSAMTSGTILPGQTLVGTGVSSGQATISNGTGTGGVGDYNVNVSQLLTTPTQITGKDPHALVFAQGAMSAFTSVATAQQIGSVDFDLYFFAEQPNQGQRNNVCNIFAAGTSCASAPWGTRQMSSGALYGGVIDIERSWGNGTNFEMTTANRPIRYKNCGGPPPTTTLASCSAAQSSPSRLPLMVDIETGNGNAGAPNILITPQEFVWAMWSTVIHGGHPQPFFGNPGHAGTEWPVGTGTAYTNFMSLTQSLAPVLNEPYATGYATGTVAGNTPSGGSGGRGIDYAFPTWPWTFTNVTTSYGFNSAGIETMAKYYSKGPRTINGLSISNGFYLFTDTSASEWGDNLFTNSAGVTSVIPNASASYTGGITGNTLTVDTGSITAGGIAEPQTLSFAGAIPNTVIIADTGGNGAAGTYTLSQTYGTPVASGTPMTSAIVAKYTYAEDSRGDGTRTVPVFYSTFGASNPTATCAGGANTGTCTFTLTFPTSADVAIFGPL